MLYCPSSAAKSLRTSKKNFLDAGRLQNILHCLPILARCCKCKFPKHPNIDEVNDFLGLYKQCYDEYWACPREIFPLEVDKKGGWIHREIRETIDELNYRSSRIDDFDWYC